MTTMETLRAFARYKTHAGYSWAMVCADGELLCETCVRENYRQCVDATKHSGRNSQWECIGLTNSGEAETTEQCSNCNKVLWEHEG